MYSIKDEMQAEDFMKLVYREGDLDLPPPNFDPLVRPPPAPSSSMRPILAEVKTTGSGFAYGLTLKLIWQVEDMLWQPSTNAMDGGYPAATACMPPLPDEQLLEDCIGDDLEFCDC